MSKINIIFLFTSFFYSSPLFLRNVKKPHLHNTEMQNFGINKVLFPPLSREIMYGIINEVGGG